MIRLVCGLLSAIALTLILPNSTFAGVLCTDDCPSSNDGECDDGGANSLYDICPLGSDCADCGPRVGAEEEPDGMFVDEPEGDDDGPGCEDTCASAYDGECDDGGPGSLYDICEYGTDCADCGVR